MPFKPVPVLLTTWTVCTRCWVPVAHLDQRRHDEACHAKDEPADLVAQYDDPALAS